MSNDIVSRPLPPKEVSSNEMHPNSEKCNDLDDAPLPTAIISSDAPVDSDGNEDPFLVTWHGTDDPDNPKNWPKSVKWKNTCAVSLFVFISPVSSSMIAPALQDVGESFGMHSKIEVYLSLAIFVLGYAVGPVFFGPASELYGRIRLLQMSNLWYLAWNLGCGFAEAKSQFFAFRFLAGIGGSAPLAIGGGAISDMWSAEERGKAMGLYTLGPILGPVVGPIAGGFIAQYSTWRWVFWSTSAAALGIQAIGLFWLRESHPATLLCHRRNRRVKETGNKALHIGAQPKTLAHTLALAFKRPLKLFFTQPIVTCMAIYVAYLFGTTYLMFATFPDVWTIVYHEEPGIGGLNYLSIAVGSFFGLILNLKVIDPMYGKLKAHNHNIGMPEFRMPSIVTYAASALAACAILRSLAGFGFPLFAPYMYNALGYGWGTSVLGFFSIGFGWMAPVIIWLYGPKLRAMSRYAAD
ncbi:hypothetical protein N8T08_001213 [Aspergillus melleus]|uniref:Uncharacterized protein n=1 Tax=Aspergillus melleus TaxID=138277 RepID=A0ACC3ANM2_9EURO|nr:hypothetical protein N8T08_001213 [Aspergillus melleus]